MPKEILCLYFEEGLNWIYAAGNTCEVYVHRLHHQKEPEYQWTIKDDREGHRQAITCMAHDENMFFTGSEDNTIKVWVRLMNKDVFLGFDFLMTLEKHENPISDMIIITESGHLTSCTTDGKIYFWNYPKKEIVKTIEKNEGFMCLSYSHRYKQLYVGTEQNNLLCFPIEEIFEQKVRGIEGGFLDPEIPDATMFPDSPIARKRTISPIREENKDEQSFEYLSDDEGGDAPPMSDMRRGPSLMGGSSLSPTMAELKKGQSLMGNSVLSPIKGTESPAGKKSFVFK